MRRFFQKAMILVPFLILLLFAGITEAEACTYEEAINADWGNYPMKDVERILNEDMTSDSDLAPNQKAECLIGNMRNFSDEFDKVSNNVKFEALTAISALETGHFKSDLCKSKNNVGGMKGASGYFEYDTIEEGIEAFYSLLSEHYLDPEGIYYEGNTIIDVSQHYNQSTHWVVMYVKVRIDMERRASKVEPIWPEEPEEFNLFVRMMYPFNLQEMEEIICQTIQELNNHSLIWDKPLLILDKPVVMLYLEQPKASPNLWNVLILRNMYKRTTKESAI